MTRSLLCIAAMLATMAAQAQTPVIGRLFSTPAERHELDVRRGTAPGPAQVAEPAAPPPAPAPLTVNGFVRRSGGKSTVWINQEAQEDARNRFSGAARAPGVSVQLPSGRKVMLKPGQSIDANAGTLKDVDEQ